MSYPHTNYLHSPFYLIIIPNKEANAKRSKWGCREEKGIEGCRFLCVVTNKDLIKLDSMPRKTAKGSQLFRQATKCISKMTAHKFRQNWAFQSIIVNVPRSCRLPQEKWPTVLFAQGPTFPPCRLIEPGPNLGWECCLLLCWQSAEFKSLWTRVCILLSKSLPHVPIQSRLLVPRFHLITPWAKNQTWVRPA